MRLLLLYLKTNNLSYKILETPGFIEFMRSDFDDLDSQINVVLELFANMFKEGNPIDTETAEKMFISHLRKRTNNGDEEKILTLPNLTYLLYKSPPSLIKTLSLFSDETIIKIIKQGKKVPHYPLIPRKRNINSLRVIRRSRGIDILNEVAEVILNHEEYLITSKDEVLLNSVAELLNLDPVHQTEEGTPLNLSDIKITKGIKNYKQLDKAAKLLGVPFNLH